MCDDGDVVIVEFEQTIIPLNVPQRLDEVTLRVSGEQWRIHKYDADPFPSQPHAHNLATGFKLDLSNGRLYDGSRDTSFAIRRKDLIRLRDVAKEKGVDLPNLEDA